MSKPAARVGDMHTCPMSDGPKPHVGGPILPPGCPTVLTGMQPQARVSDMATCVSPAPDIISSGAATVIIQGLPAARMTDQTAHGGSVTIGLSNVLIGGPLYNARPIRRVFNSAKDEWQFQYGDSIFISPDPSDPTYQSRALAALIRLDTTPTLRRAINDVEASGHTLNIMPYVPPPGWGPYNAYCQADTADNGTPGVGSNSTIGWDPDVHGFGAPGTTPDASQPGSDVLLGHEMIHGTHNATGSYPSAGPTDYNGINIPEDRNTVGLPAGTYNRPGDSLNGRALPDTTGMPYTENGLRQDYADRGIPSPVTGQPPIQRPSYYNPTATGGPGSPW